MKKDMKTGIKILSHIWKIKPTPNCAYLDVGIDSFCCKVSLPKELADKCNGSQVIIYFDKDFKITSWDLTMFARENYIITSQHGMIPDLENIIFNFLTG